MNILFLEILTLLTLMEKIIYLVLLEVEIL